MAQQLRARYLDALAELFPAARQATVRAVHVSREHAATFKATPASVKLRPAASTAIPGLALAGAWTDTGWPATLEGAVRSGHTAARLTLQGLGQPTSDRQRSVRDQLERQQRRSP